MAEKQGLLAQARLSPVQMYALQLSLLLDRRRSDEEMMFAFKTAVMSYSPSDLAPVVFPEMFEADESVIDQVINDPEAQVSYELVEPLSISLAEAEDIIAQFRTE